MDLLLWLQGLRDPVLTAFFSFCTFLGSEDFILVLVPILYWCVSRTLGLRIGVVFFASQYLNEGLKGLVDEPRPGPPVVPLAPDTAPGSAWPSGHAQNSAAVWGLLAGLVRRAWLLGAAVGLTFLIGVSRLYLGEHWPGDVLSGWALGAALAILGLLAVQTLPGVVAQGAALAPAVGAAVVALAVTLLDPTDITVRLGGAVLGLLIGWWAERRWVGFEAPATWPVQGAKIVLGLAGAFALRTVLKPLFAGLPGPILPDLLRYAIVLLWVIWWAPAIFVRLFGRPVTATPAPAPPAPAG